MTSAIVITYNNEDTIKIVLEKLIWADEVIMVDAFSQDRTPEIGKELGVKVLERRWEGYASQRRYALQMAKFDWILSIDADEVLDDEVIDSIKRIVSEKSEFDGYMIRIVTYFLNRPLMFASRPFYQMRLFKKGRAVLTDKLVHEHFEVARSSLIRKGTIKHYTSQTIQNRVEKIDLYSTLKAQEISRGGRKVSHSDILIYPIKAFVKNYLIDLGFLDGIRGLIWTICVSMEYFLIYAKVKFDIIDNTRLQ